MKKIKQIAEQIMRIAVDSNLILKNPFSGVKVPSIEPEMRRALTESEIDLITENWRGTRMDPAAMIMLYAGLRIGEVLALEWADIDFEKRTITVSKARNEQGFCLNGGITMEEHTNDNRAEFSQQQPITEDKRVPFEELIVEIRY